MKLGHGVNINMNSKNEKSSLAKLDWIAVASIILVSILIGSHSFIINGDDLAAMLSTDTYETLISGTRSNYRFAPEIAHYVLHLIHVSYFANIGIWSACFALAMYGCSYMFCRYVGIKQITLFFLCVSMQAFWADVYRFTVVYLTFAMSLAFSAASLWSLTKSDWGSCRRVFVATIFGYLSAISYQSNIWLFAFAPIVATMHGDPVRMDIRRLVEAAAACFAACALTLVNIKLVNHYFPDIIPTRQLGGIHAALSNAMNYLKSTSDLFVSVDGPYRAPFGLLVPIHERIVYGGVIVIALGYAIWQRRLLTIICVIAGIILIVNPINAIVNDWWPSPRSMTAASFFLVGMLFVVGRRVKWLERSAALIIVFSLGNQISVMDFLYRQASLDESVAQQMISDIRKIAPITPQTKIAMQMTWHTPFQMRDELMLDLGASMLGQPWAQLPLLRHVSGVMFIQVRPPARACDGYTEPWEVRKVDDTIVVCGD